MKREMSPKKWKGKEIEREETYTFQDEASRPWRKIQQKLKTKAEEDQMQIQIEALCCVHTMLSSQHSVLLALVPTKQTDLHKYFILNIKVF